MNLAGQDHQAVAGLTLLDYIGWLRSYEARRFINEVMSCWSAGSRFL